MISAGMLHLQMIHSIATRT